MRTIKNLYDTLQWNLELKKPTSSLKRHTSPFPPLMVPRSISYAPSVVMNHGAGSSSALQFKETPPPASTDVPRHEPMIVGPSIILRPSRPFSSHLSPRGASHHFIPLCHHRLSTTARCLKPPPRRPPPSPRMASLTAAPMTSSTAALMDGGSSSGSRGSSPPTHPKTIEPP